MDEMERPWNIDQIIHITGDVFIYPTKQETIMRMKTHENHFQITVGSHCNKVSYDIDDLI